MADKDTIAAYDQFAESYDRSVVDFWDNFPTEIIDELAAKSPGKKLLDLGSGSGRDALLLKRHSFDVTCADGSKSMVTMTEKLGFESALCDFNDLPFADASFDSVWAYTSLIHVPVEEVRGVLAKVHGLLKPGGTFVFGAIEGSSQAERVEHRTMPGATRYFRYYHRGELKELVESCGFEFIIGTIYEPGGHHTYFQQLFRRV